MNEFRAAFRREPFLLHMLLYTIDVRCLIIIDDRQRLIHNIIVSGYNTRNFGGCITGSHTGRCSGNAGHFQQDPFLRGVAPLYS